MKNEPPEPNDETLSTLLSTARPSPPLPPRFQEGVWRRIEREDVPAKDTWLDRLLRQFPRPRWAVAAMVGMLLISVGAGLLDGAASAKQMAQARYLAAVAPSTLR